MSTKDSSATAEDRRLDAAAVGADIRDRFATIERDAAALDGMDAAPVRSIIERLHVLGAGLHARGVRAELATRRDAGDVDAAQQRRHHQLVVEPAMAAGRRGVDAALLDPARPRVAACLDRCFGPQLTANMRLRLATTELDPQLREAVANAASGYTQRFGAARMILDGAERPLSAARKPLASQSRASRRAAFDAQVAAIAQLAPGCDVLLERAVRARGASARRLGFESFVEYRYAELRRTSYGPADVARLREAVREHIVPIAAEVRARQAAALGDGPLVHPADTEYHPDHDITAGIVVDELPARVERALTRVAPELGQVVADARRDARLDVAARPGKAPGAYCATFPDSGLPFTLMNAVGIARDAKTIVHEFGHACQSALSAQIMPWELRKPTIEACEMHSMSLELLALPAMDEVFTAPDDHRRYARMLLETGVTHAAYCCAVDGFQHELYAPGAESLDGDARASLWAACLRPFAPGIDHDAEPTWLRVRWVAQRHIFLFPLYFIDYAIAQVAAWQLWLDSRDDRPGAVARYLRLCRLGGTVPYTELLDEAGISDPLDPSTIAALAPRLRAALLEL